MGMSSQEKIQERTFSRFPLPYSPDVTQPTLYLGKIKQKTSVKIASEKMQSDALPSDFSACCFT